jgi:hypothetical protein
VLLPKTEPEKIPVLSFSTSGGESSGWGSSHSQQEGLGAGVSIDRSSPEFRVHVFEFRVQVGCVVELVSCFHIELYICTVATE